MQLIKSKLQSKLEQSAGTDVNTDMSVSQGSKTKSSMTNFHRKTSEETPWVMKDFFAFFGG